MSFYYPTLDEQTIKNLEIVKQLAQQNPTIYFLESPYSGDIERMVSEWFISSKKTITGTGTGTGTEANLTDDRDAWDMLYSETKTLFLGLKEAKFETLGETSEKMQYFRTAASLLEKLVSLQERALGLKEVGDFQREVMDIMESVLTPTQRTGVMERLASFTQNNTKENAD